MRKWKTHQRIAAPVGFIEGHSLQGGNIFLKPVYLLLSERGLLHFHNIFPLKPVTGGAAAVHIWKDYYHILRRNTEFRQVAACPETVRDGNLPIGLGKDETVLRGAGSPA